mgnify:CR=1 FL=1
MKRALVIYSGGLDTTVSIPLLGEEGFDEVYTVTVDVGQPEEDIRRAEERAKALGTCHTTVDAKETFASEYCAPAIQFNADYFGYPLSTAIARPLIARCAADVAKEIGKLDAVVHGCTGKGNDQFRIEFGLRLHLQTFRFAHQFVRRTGLEAQKSSTPRGSAYPSHSRRIRSAALMRISGGGASKVADSRTRTTPRRRRFSSGRCLQRTRRMRQSRLCSPSRVECPSHLMAAG